MSQCISTVFKVSQKAVFWWCLTVFQQFSYVYQHLIDYKCFQLKEELWRMFDVAQPKIHSLSRNFILGLKCIIKHMLILSKASWNALTFDEIHQIRQNMYIEHIWFLWTSRYLSCFHKFQHLWIISMFSC